MSLGILYTTIDSLEAARSLAAAVVDAELAACVNLIPGMHAIHRWGGERHEDIEIVVLMKTRGELREDLLAFVAEHHPYDCPALLWLDIDRASDAFGAWVAAMTKPA